jgi:hypothetical protein
VLVDDYCFLSAADHIIAFWLQFVDSSMSSRRAWEVDEIMMTISQEFELSSYKETEANNSKYLTNQNH